MINQNEIIEIKIDYIELLEHIKSYENQYNIEIIIEDATFKNLTNYFGIIKGFRKNIKHFLIDIDYFDLGIDDLIDEIKTQN